MKNVFAGYYRPTDSQFDLLWKEGVFVFDANVLLNIYRYSADTQRQLIEVLQRLRERIWIPFQAALEFHENTPEVIEAQSRAYADAVCHIKEALRSLETTLGKYRRHAYLRPDELMAPLYKAAEKVYASVEKQNEKHPDLILDDPLRRKIAELFEGHVGPSYSLKQLEAAHEKASERYTQQIPPGFKDVKKPVPERFGDAIIWFQLLDFAKQEKKPIIFVTDDAKDDWWREFRGRTLGPRPELVQEMHDQAGVLFFMYSSDQFIERAQRFLGIAVENETIEEVRDIQKDDRTKAIEADRTLMHGGDPVHRAATWSGFEDAGVLSYSVSPAISSAFSLDDIKGLTVPASIVSASLPGSLSERIATVSLSGLGLSAVPVTLTSEDIASLGIVRAKDLPGDVRLAIGLPSASLTGLQSIRVPSTSLRATVAPESLTLSSLGKVGHPRPSGESGAGNSDETGAATGPGQP